MQKLRNRVLDMPWVADVSIRRVWPDKLNMVVTEEVPLARWGEDALINIGGGVFRPPSLDGHLGLVRLDGPAGSEQRVVSSCRPLRPPQMRANCRSARSAWTNAVTGGFCSTTDDTVARSRERRLSPGSVLPVYPESGRATGTTPGAHRYAVCTWLRRALARTCCAGNRGA